MTGSRQRWTPPVRGVLLASGATSTATMLQATVLFKHVYDITGRELDLGLLGLFEFAPAALLVLVSGSIADRFDRRRVASAGLAIQWATALGLLLYLASEPTAVGPIFALAFAFGVGRAIQAPAGRALSADVVAPADLPWLVARSSITWQISSIVGPVLGGVLYAVDPRLPYVVVAGLLTLGLVLLQTVEPLVRHQPAPAAPKGSTTPGQRWAEAVEGLRVVRHHPVLLGAISLDLFAVLFGGAIALLPALAEERLGAGDIGYGWLRAATGIGAAVVTLALARRPLTRNIGHVLFASVALFGVATLVLGATRTYLVAFVAILVLSGADAMSVFIRASLVPLVTPRATRGRVLAVENVFIGASNELGSFESGVAGQLLGPAGAVVLGGAATLVIAGAWAVLFPDLRSVDRFPEPVEGSG
jgi:MFS family permease